MKPLFLRLWHWLNAIAITGLLLTVLLRKTFLSWRANTALIQSKIETAGGQIDPTLARDIAVTMRDAMWEWHYIFGFGLVALFFFRIFVSVRHKETKPLQFTKSLHHNLKQISYAAFYLATFFMSVTGLTLYFKDTLGISKELTGVFKESHEFAMWFFVAFSAMHIVGVVIAEIRDEPGIVSKMINGGKK